MSPGANWTYDQLPLASIEAEHRWRALWERSPQRSVFSAVEYAATIAETFGLECQSHFVSGRDGEDAVGVLVFVRRLGPYRTVVVPPFTPHSSIIFGTMPSETEIHQRRSALDILLKNLEEQFHALRFQLHPGCTDVRTYTWRGWQVRPYYTYIASLDGAESALKGWSQRTRRTARNERDRFVVQENHEAAAQIARTYIQSLRRQRHRLPASHERITRLLDALYQRGLARLFTITPSDSSEPSGGLAMLTAGQEAYYWLGGSVPGSSMTVLIGAVLPVLCESGIRTIDYVGANTPSIAEFKRQFGGKLVTYYGVEKYNRPELRMVEHARALRARLSG